MLHVFLKLEFHLGAPHDEIHMKDEQACASLVPRQGGIGCVSGQSEQASQKIQMHERLTRMLT